MVLKLGRRYPRFRRALNAAKRQAKRLRRRLRGWKVWA
jgi:hypothetical protein